jgi:formylglycine-generating enzyme required for sulfatase activity
VARFVPIATAVVLAGLPSACGRIGFDAIAPSCTGLAATCGPGGNESCCDSPVVTGGTFYRSYDSVGYDDMSFPATISDFRLDTYEITVGRFRAFVEAGQGTQADPPEANAGAHPRLPTSGWDASWNSSLAADTKALLGAVTCSAGYDQWTDVPGPNEDHPMNCISWFEAMAFCAWDGGYLPTDAEWNYAAAGGAEQRAFPWSSPPTSLTIDDSHASYQCSGDGASECTPSDILVVGSRPAGDTRWGQSDLSGNVWEWTLDWYATYINPCDDCADLTATGNRIVRGGDFNDGAGTLRAAQRTAYGESNHAEHVGARCARPL